jgi:hypothetical protein
LGGKHPPEQSINAIHAKIRVGVDQILLSRVKRSKDPLKYKRLILKQELQGVVCVLPTY